MSERKMFFPPALRLAAVAIALSAAALALPLPGFAVLLAYDLAKYSPHHGGA